MQGTREPFLNSTLTCTNYFFPTQFVHVWAEISTYLAALLKDLQLLANFLNRRVMTEATLYSTHPDDFAEQRANESKKLHKRGVFRYVHFFSQNILQHEGYRIITKKKTFLNGKLLDCAMGFPIPAWISWVVWQSKNLTIENVPSQNICQSQRSWNITPSKFCFQCETHNHYLFKNQDTNKVYKRTSSVLCSSQSFPLS